MKKYFLLLPLLALLNCSGNTEQWAITSPDGMITGQILMDSEGQLSYSLHHQGQGRQAEIIRPSPLGIIREDQEFIRLKLVGSMETGPLGENYTMATGKRKDLSTRYNELTLEFENEYGYRLDMVFRAYDEGFAFKYVFPGTSPDTLTVLRELTAFAMPDGNAWLQPYDSITAYSPAYERNYEGPLPVGTPAPGEEGWCFPALFEVNGYWALLTESNLQHNFYGSHLKQTGDPSTYAVVPPEEEEAFGYGHAVAVSTLPWDMPWRVVITGVHAGEILESNLVTHLAKPSILEDDSWVRPGRASWGWWSGYLAERSTDTPEKLRDFIDLAQEMQWEYSLVDAGWNTRRGLDIKELAAYAKERNVKLLLWYNSGGPLNRVNAGPRDRMYDRDIRREEMRWMQELGISGVKIDFFSSDKQDVIRLYLDILEDAADFELTVNFHGATIPRGWHRTYPHLVSLESVKGSEGYIYHGDFEQYGPVHTSILPFTRNVIGPMDYTPVALSTSNVPHRTSFSYEVALAVAFESGIQHFADHARVFRGLPEGVKTLLSTVPAAWDDTRYLSGYPGQDLVMARRKGEHWFLAGINPEDKPKTLEVDFGFLEPGRSYEATFITDGADNTRFQTTNKTITAESREQVEVLPVGGFSARLVPASD
jgi:hypothetical protein